MFIRPVLLGLVLPAAALFAAAFAWRNREREAAGRVLALLLAALFLPSTAVWSGWPPFPPVTTTQQIGYAVLALAAGAFAVRRWPDRWAWAARTAALFAVLGWAAWPKVGRAWTWPEAAALVAFWTVLLAAAWGAVERRALRTAALPLHAPLVLVAGSAAALLFLGGSALLSQWGGSLAALLAAAGAALAFRKADETVSVAGAALPALGLLLVNGVWYSALPWPVAVLLVAALGAPSLADRLLPRVLTPPWRAAWSLAAAGACAALAAAICWAVIRPSLSEY